MSEDLALPPASDRATNEQPRADEWTMSVAVGVMQVAGLASIGAGAVHAGAAGLHAEHPTLARLFVVAAVAQIAAGMIALVRGGRVAALAAALVNAGAVGVWGTTRLWGIDRIEGLEEAEAAQFTDTACAVLGAIALAAAATALVRRRTRVSAVRLGVPAFAVATVTLAAMLVGANHVHGHDATADHAHDDDVAAEAVVAAPTDWPRPWDPSRPVDVSGVDGVTAEQQLRATALIEGTMRELPAFADVATAAERGYRSIGDAATGFEHYVNYSLINDDVILDPTQPESLVYRVDGARRTLVSAMFIAGQRPVDDPELVDFAGRLMQWHIHDNLCWQGGDDGPRVVAVTDAAGNCPDATVRAGGDNPMVHVWIAPHECGPFAALEGHGAGQAAAADGTRTDQCNDGAAADGHDHAHSPSTGDGGVSALGSPPAGQVAGQAADDQAAAPRPYDPELPIDLSGTPGVTPQQQAFAENLISATLVDLPQWADTGVAKLAGFHSIGDGATGYEHYIQWGWINDDVWLDPDHPESLVYRVEPDGSRTLASAMYMLPESMTLDDVPDFGGPLMQWHIHTDLCFDTSNPQAPRVGGITDSAGRCTAPLERFGEAPMIHVWIVPHECGPFAALEGVGAGQIAAGEQRLCDHAHGGNG